MLEDFPDNAVKTSSATLPVLVRLHGLGSATPTSAVVDVALSTWLPKPGQIAVDMLPALLHRAGTSVGNTFNSRLPVV